MRYNVIGDIHCRESFKSLLRDDCVNIFVGDYFSPYDENISFADQVKIFEDIIQYKKDHPETVLLIGNHDGDHWVLNERSSRFDSTNYNVIKQLFENNKELFSVAYSINNTAIVSHAGVSIVWYLNKRYKMHILNIVDLMCSDIHANNIIDAIEQYLNPPGETTHFRPAKTLMSELNLFLWKNKFYSYNSTTQTFDIIEIPTPDELASWINNAFFNDCKYSWFDFKHNATYFDTCGESMTHGPLWIRPDELEYANIYRYSNIKQFVGHTQHSNIKLSDHNLYGKYINLDGSYSDINRIAIIYTDCLGHSTESVIYDTYNNSFVLNKN